MLTLFLITAFRLRQEISADVISKKRIPKDVWEYSAEVKTSIYSHIS